MFADVLVGRDHTLDSIDELLLAVAYGQSARALVITGPSGSGRTSVITVAAARAARQGWAVGMAAIGVQDSLAAALDRALDSALRQCPPGGGFARVSGARRRFVQEAAASPFDLGSPLAHLLPVLAAEPGVPRVALFIDDLHNATPSARQALLDGLSTMASTGAPVGLIATHELETGKELPQLNPGQIHAHALRPLGDGDLLEIARRFGMVLDGGALESLARTSGGLPRNVVSVLQLVREGLNAQAAEPLRHAAQLDHAL